MKKPIHQGKNVARFREMLNLKAEAFAYQLGTGWAPRKYLCLNKRKLLKSLY